MSTTTYQQPNKAGGYAWAPPRTPHGQVYAAIETLTGEHPPQDALLIDLMFGDAPAICAKAEIIEGLDMDLGLDLTDADAEACHTVGDLIALVARRSRSPLTAGEG